MLKWHAQSALSRRGRPLTQDLVRVQDGIAASLREFHACASRAVEIEQGEELQNRIRSDVKQTSRAERTAAATADIQSLRIVRQPYGPPARSQDDRPTDGGRELKVRFINRSQPTNISPRFVTRSRASTNPRSNARANPGQRGSASNRMPGGRTRGARGNQRRGSRRTGIRGQRSTGGEEDFGSERYDFSREEIDYLVKQADSKRVKPVPFTPPDVTRQYVSGQGAATLAGDLGARDLVLDRLRLLSMSQDAESWRDPHALAKNLQHGHMVSVQTEDEGRRLEKLGFEPVSHEGRQVLLDKLVKGTLSSLDPETQASEPLKRAARQTRLNGSFTMRDQEILLAKLRATGVGAERQRR